MSSVGRSREAGTSAPLLDARLIHARELDTIRGPEAEGLGIIVALVEEENADSAKLFANAGYSAQIPVRYFHKRTHPDI